jgi:hypothetical protein
MVWRPLQRSVHSHMLLQRRCEWRRVPRKDSLVNQSRSVMSEDDDGGAGVVIECLGHRCPASGLEAMNNNQQQ